MYIYCMRRRTDAINRKRPKKWGIKCWFLFRDNASARRSVSVKDFLANNNVTTLEHPTNPTDQNLVYYIITARYSTFDISAAHYNTSY